MTRKNMMAGNWKMNKTVAEAVVLTQDISNQYDPRWEDVDVVLCPPFVDLKPAKTVLDFDKVKISVGAQDVHWESEGAYTGEISVPMLKEIGCDFCIVGHSERRDAVRRDGRDGEQEGEGPHCRRHRPDRVRAASRLPCATRARPTEYVCAQVRAAFAGVDAVEAKDAVVAYEPIWAIGTGRTATPEQAQEVCAAVRATLADLFGDETAQGMRVLYGGSMKPEQRGRPDLAQPDIDGGLIGGAALKASSFKQLVEARL